ncbi:unnamed protein product [Musa acuminata var. zebrina]
MSRTRRRRVSLADGDPNRDRSSVLGVAASPAMIHECGCGWRTAGGALHIAAGKLGSSLFFSSSSDPSSLAFARLFRSPDITMMQQAIPFGGGGEIRRAVEENPVVVVGRSGCCMVHVVRRLLQGQGVNPVVCEVGEDADEAALVAGLQGADDDIDLAAAALPAVFVGGRLVGGLERLVAVHIAGELVPILKRAGALWL